MSLSCLYCGHELGDVLTPGGRRPSSSELRAAYAASPGILAPEWDAHGDPRCPRCRARLFMEVVARSVRTYSGRIRPTTARELEGEETEDAYAREDVYVPASDMPD